MILWWLLSISAILGWQQLRFVQIFWCSVRIVVETAIAVNMAIVTTVLLFLYTNFYLIWHRAIYELLQNRQKYNMTIRVQYQIIQK